VVVDQLAAAASEDRRTVGKACPLLLAIVGGEPPDAAPVWKLRQIEALPLPAGQARQEGETNLDDGGELREGCLRNRFEMGQIVNFWFWQRLCRARPVL
jgi:hypothetical protein